MNDVVQGREAMVLLFRNIVGARDLLKAVGEGFSGSVVFFGDGVVVNATGRASRRALLDKPLRALSAARCCIVQIQSSRFYA